MGKGRQPTPSELRFVYELLDEGYSDADILAKYEELKKHGKLGSLPYREDIRFIRQRRKEYEAAKTVLKAKLEMQSDPFLAKAREEHLIELHNMIVEWKILVQPPPKLQGYILHIEYSDPFRERVFSLEALFKTESTKRIVMSLKEHLRYEDIWRNTDDVVSTFMKFEQCCTKLIEDIRAEGETWPVSVKGAFGWPLVYYIACGFR